MSQETLWMKHNMYQGIKLERHRPIRPVISLWWVYVAFAFCGLSIVL
jgi:hypothetical protein